MLPRQTEEPLADEVLLHFVAAAGQTHGLPHEKATTELVGLGCVWLAEHCVSAREFQRDVIAMGAPHRR